LNNSYSYLFFDSSFVSRLYRVDNTCELLEYFQLYADGAECVIEHIQYSQSPCNHFNAPFRLLREFITDEEIIEKAISSERINKDLSKIYGDPVDVKIFIWAENTDNVLVLTCDKNLLKLCQEYDICHSCFKNAIVILDNWMEGDILTSDAINANLLRDGDDPFFNLERNTRCETHCGPSEICIVQQ